MTQTALLDFNAIEDLWKQEAGDIANGVTITGNKISTNNKIFTLPNGVQTNKPLTVIVVDYRNYSVYYPGTYDPKNKVPPVCWAIASDNKTSHQNLVPGNNVQNPVNPQCEGCKWAQWKTGQGGKGKACKERIRVALVPLDGLTDKTPVWLLDVSPTGLDSFGKLVNLVKAEHGKPIMAGITKISFMAGVDYAKLNFNPTDWRPFTEAERHAAVIAYHLSQKESTREMLEQKPAGALDN